MDPQACLKEIIENLQAGAYCAATMQIHDLNAWIAKGGFCPKAKVPDGYYADGTSKPERSVEVFRITNNDPGHAAPIASFRYLDRDDNSLSPVLAIRLD